MRMSIVRKTSTARSITGSDSGIGRATAAAFAAEGADVVQLDINDETQVAAASLGGHDVSFWWWRRGSSVGTPG